MLAIVSGAGGAANTKYVHANSLYSPAAITDSSGAVVERYKYDAYGKRTIYDAAGTVVRTASSYSFPVTFTGRYEDTETGLLYFRARYYSASQGRFIGRDPIRYSDGMNLYFAYYVPDDLDPDGTTVAGGFGPGSNDGTRRVCAGHCCCCPESIDLTQALFTNKPGMRDFRIGHILTADIKANMVIGPVDGNCKFTVNDDGNIKDSTSTRPNYPEPFTEGQRRERSAWDGFFLEFMLAQGGAPCGKPVKLGNAWPRWQDTPSILVPKGVPSARLMFLELKLEKTPGCVCEKDSVKLTIWQLLFSDGIQGGVE